MNLRLPDACLLKFTDPGLKNIDQFPIKIGSNDRAACSPRSTRTSLTSIFKGVVVSLEPEFGQGTTLGFRAYDGSHALNQTKRADTYQNMTAADIARKVGNRAGIDEGTIDSAGPAFDFIQQNNETDWEFLWKLAQRIDFEVLVIDHKLYFRKAGPPAGTQDINLKWGDGTLISFRPRVTGRAAGRPGDGAGARHLAATSRSRRPRASASPSPRSGSSAPTPQRRRRAARSSSPTGPVTSQQEAADLAKAIRRPPRRRLPRGRGRRQGQPRRSRPARR